MIKGAIVSIIRVDDTVPTAKNSVVQRHFRREKASARADMQCSKTPQLKPLIIKPK